MSLPVGSIRSVKENEWVSLAKSVGYYVPSDGIFSGDQKVTILEASYLQNNGFWTRSGNEVTDWWEDYTAAYERAAEAGVPGARGIGAGFVN